MNPEENFHEEDTLRQEYDFDMSKAVRGKYAQRIAEEGTNVVLLDEDVYEVFRDSEAVNEALRSLIALSQRARATHGVRKPHSTKQAERVKGKSGNLLNTQN